jgi:hypothetical protein
MGSLYSPEQEAADIERFKSAANDGVDQIEINRIKLLILLNSIKGLKHKTKCCGNKITNRLDYSVRLNADNKRYDHCIICKNILEIEDIEADLNYCCPVQDTCIFESVKKFEDIQKYMSKLDTLKYILNVALLKAKERGSNNDVKKNRPKIIIFCDNGYIFSTITIIGEKLGIKAQSLDNQNVEIITKVINDFGHDDTDMLLIESNLYGCGLNLEMCTDLILFHGMDNDEQVIGRAQRPGRDPNSNLLVHKLHYPNEM